MKILVISDSHGCSYDCLKAVELTEPELILHLGDHNNLGDINAVITRYQVPIRAVMGNCDYMSDGPGEIEFEIVGKRFFMTHGHLYDVKMGLGNITRVAESRGVDVLLFGHTHIPYYAESGGIVMVNPGSIGKEEKTYAVLEIKNGEVACEIGSVI